MYHDVAADAPGTSGGSAYFAVSAATFDRQLAMIGQAGMHGCSIAHALTGAPPGSVAISFDDGDLGQATRGFPALVRHGMAATFFVTTDWVGRPGYGSWEQLREMRNAGMSIQSHTHTHPFLSELGADALRDELRRSRDLLDERLEQRTTMLALPGGDFPRRELRGILSEEGYAVIATSRWGLNPDDDRGSPRYVKRCTVRGEQTDESFASVVAGDSWLSVKRRTREGILAFVRSTLGPSRYARWRRGVLDVAGSGD